MNLLVNPVLRWIRRIKLLNDDHEKNDAAGNICCHTTSIAPLNATNAFGMIYYH